MVLQWVRHVYIWHHIASMCFLFFLFFWNWRSASSSRVSWGHYGTVPVYHIAEQVILQWNLLISVETLTQNYAVTGGGKSFDRRNHNFANWYCLWLWAESQPCRGFRTGLSVLTHVLLKISLSHTLHGVCVCILLLVSYFPSKMKVSHISFSLHSTCYCFGKVLYAWKRIFHDDIPIIVISWHLVLNVGYY
jgi:hypothetical protein